MKNMTDFAAKEMIRQAFKYACWEDSAEHRRKLADIKDEASEYIFTRPELIEQVESAIKAGKVSYNLKKDLIELLNKGMSSEEAEQWIEKESQEYDQIKYDLSKELKNYTERQQKQQKRHTEKYTPSLAQVVVDGLHNNNIRALKPSKKWQILIDETGSHFNPDDMEGLKPSDKKIGKVIALAIPQGVNLPKLPNKFHAIDETDKKVENVISTLLTSEVGIFGYSMTDSYHSIHSWMAAIVQLTKWVMYLLPMEEEEEVNVEFLIEQRGQFDSKKDLQPLQEHLESTLKDLAPARYKHLKLKLVFMAKDGHPANGYVDTIANLWGSPSQSRRKILARTALPDNCLIRSSDRSLEQLLLALQSTEPLDDRLWFELCEYAGNESQYSLANQFLNELGKKINKDLAVWNAYVISIKQRLQNKAFTTAGLTAALQWLITYSPDESTLDDSLLLQFKSSQLALKNHQGHVDLSLVAECIALANELKEEMAVDCCNVALRIATSTTNAFDFDSIIDWIKQWIAEPVAVPGLLNHGKLHSVLGQIYAFNTEYELALASFELAQDSFAKLSTEQHRKNNKLQTQIYKIIVLMDQGNTQAIALLHEVLDKELNKVKTRPKRVARLARSQDKERFIHHVFLRACLTFPNEMKDEIEQYLAVANDWFVGKSHPWMLIQAYRGWLLQKQNESTQAKQCLESAVTECLSEQQGPTVQWMGLMLLELSQSLGLKLDIEQDAVSHALLNIPEKAPRDVLEKWGATVTDEKRIELLKEGLPFNFH